MVGIGITLGGGTKTKQQAGQQGWLTLSLHSSLSPPLCASSPLAGCHVSGDQSVTVPVVNLPAPRQMEGRRRGPLSALGFHVQVKNPLLCTQTLFFLSFFSFSLPPTPFYFRFGVALRLQKPSGLLGTGVQCCLTSTETIRLIRDGCSVLFYVHRDHKDYGEPRAATSTFTQLLSS